MEGKFCVAMAEFPIGAWIPEAFSKYILVNL
jgi:hypothetical protein